MGYPKQRVRALVESQIEGRWFGLLGEPRVNVLDLNLALDALSAVDLGRRQQAAHGDRCDQAQRASPDALLSLARRKAGGT